MCLTYDRFRSSIEKPLYCDQIIMKAAVVIIRHLSCDQIANAVSFLTTCLLRPFAPNRITGRCIIIDMHHFYDRLHVETVFDLE